MERSHIRLLFQKLHEKVPTLLLEFGSNSPANVFLKWRVWIHRLTQVPSGAGPTVFFRCQSASGLRTATHGPQRRGIGEPTLSACRDLTVLLSDFTSVWREEKRSVSLFKFSPNF